MVKMCSAILFAAAGMLVNGVVGAGAADQIRVGEPYVRAVPPGQPNSAAFMTLSNDSTVPQVLVEASSPSAEAVELHTHTMADGMMKMRRVDRIDLPAGETVSLKPGGLHVMLIGLKQSLKAGDQVDLTLKFGDESTRAVSAPVRTIESTMMKH